MSLLFASCEHDEPMYRIDIETVVSCSPDLLEFVTPTVVFTNEEGIMESRELSISDFKQTDDWTGYIGLDKFHQEGTKIQNNVATLINSFSVPSPSNLKVSLKYDIKSDYSFDKDNYIFFQNLGVKVTLGDVIKEEVGQAMIENISPDFIDTYLTLISKWPPSASIEITPETKK